jgi:hypothetical protein
VVAASRPAGSAVVYILIVVLLGAGAFVYRVRVLGLLSCPAAASSADSYVAYCHGETFGDYDHGAVWFDLEPEVRRRAESADVLFLGSSRMQFAFSTDATSSWFTTQALDHYLFGFGYTENVAFMTPLLETMRPRARAYVINVDRFFMAGETPPAADILHSPEASRKKYEEKQRWQSVHRWVCGTLPLFCGDQVAYVRRRADGHWRLDGATQGSDRLVPAAVGEGSEGDRSRWPGFQKVAETFVTALPVERPCVILTLVPYRDTRRAEASAIAGALGLDLIQPTVDGLTTVDGSHLDVTSAERWSAAFFEAAGSRIRQCVN